MCVFFWGGGLIVGGKQMYGSPKILIGLRQNKRAIFFFFAGE